MTKQQLKIQEMVLTYSPEGVYKMVLDGVIPRFPNGFWSMPLNNVYAARCTRYLIEVVLKLNRQQVCDNISVTVIKKYKLASMLSTLGLSVFDVLENAYPGEFKPWELNFVSNYWTKENYMLAIDWLINEKLGWTLEDVKNNMSVKVIRDNKLGSPLLMYYNESLSAMLVDYYGEEKLKPWELKKTYVPNNYWNDKTVKYAMTWLFKEKLKWSIEEVKDNFCGEVLDDNGLGTVRNTHINGSLYNAVRMVYGNEIMPWELKKITNDFWGVRSNEIMALKYVRDMNGWTNREFTEKLSKNILADNELLGLYKRYSSLDSIKELIKEIR